MSLVNIPTQVWQSIFFDLVSLPEMVRCDLATSSFSRSVSPFCTIFSEHLFTFSEKNKLASTHLEKFLWWMQSRNVYLKELFVQTNCSPQWGEILKWTGNRIRLFTLQAFSSKAIIFEFMASFCTNLASLAIKYSSTISNHSLQ